MKLNQTLLAAALAVAVAPLASTGHAAGVAASLYPGQALPNAGLDTPCSAANQIVSADFNGDGIADLATGDWISGCTDADGNPVESGGVWVWFGKADGTYGTPAFYKAGDNPDGIAVADLDDDGYLDIVTGNDTSPGQISVLLNKGDGTFDTHKDYSPDTSTNWFGEQVAAGDVTGDGNADVIVIGRGSGAYVVSGNGDGTLDDNNANVQKLTLTTVGYANSIAIVDINGDKIPDLVISDQPDAKVFLGHDNGLMSTTADQQIDIGSGAGARSIAAGDVDEDGRPDIIAASEAEGTVFVLLNEDGTLTQGKSYTLPDIVGPFPIRLADIDGDGHLDIFAPDDYCIGDSNYVLYGNGDGSFTDPDPVPMGICAYGATVVDTASGQPDLISATGWAWGLVTRARNLGHRKFYTYATYRYGLVDDSDTLHGYQPYDMAVGDFNGDGSPDAVTANYGDNSLSLLLGDGHGGFNVPTVYTLPAGDGARAVAVADVDGDGKSDVVTAGDDAAALYVYLGDGAGGLAATPVTSSINSATIEGIAIGDIDGDGTPDAVIAGTTGGVQVCQGDGAGAFDCTAYSALAVSSAIRVALSDLDGDGDLDLVVTSFHSNGTDYESYVYRGDGKGGFVASATLTTGSGTVHDEPWGIAVGDIDEDGKADIVLGTEGRYTYAFLGNGNGVFGGATSIRTGYTDDAQPYFVTLADVNDDGHLDMVAANDYESTIGIALGNGDGTFDSPFVLASGYPFPLAVSDLDGDGEPDILSANYGDGSSLISSTVSVYFHNHAPAVQALDLKTNQDTAVSGVVTATDEELNTVKFAVATQPAHGKLSDFDGDTGSFTYTPTSGFSGDDSFTFTASDGLNRSPAGTVNVTVTAVTPPPPDDSGDGNTGGNDNGGTTTTPVSSPSGGGGGGLGLLSLLSLGLCALRRKAAG